jgi:hypothetical protein
LAPFVGAATSGVSTPLSLPALEAKVLDGDPLANPLGVLPPARNSTVAAHDFLSPYAPPAFDSTASTAAPVKLLIPAVGMLIISGLTILFTLYRAVDFAIHPERAPFLSRIERDRIRIEGHSPIFTLSALATGGTVVLVNAAIIYGAIQMMRMRKWDTAKAVAAVALIPCCSVMCLNIPLGVWALIVLNQADVKQQFQ